MSTGVVSVFVVSPDTRSERRLELHTTVEQLKGKLELITGIPVANQKITLCHSENDPSMIAELADDSKPLGFYGLESLMLLKVDDTDPSVTLTGQLTDVSQVDKFELTDVEYASRPDTVMAFKQRNNIGRFAPKDTSNKPKYEDSVDIALDSRCEVESAEVGFSKRGTVKFVGTTKFGTGEGVWVGVEYDEPFGKNDGSVQGVRYFTCKPKYGVFVRPDKVKVGDFPEVGIDFEDEEM